MGAPFPQGQANLCAFEDIVSLARHFVPAQSVVVERRGGGGGQLGRVHRWLGRGQRCQERFLGSLD